MQEIIVTGMHCPNCQKAVKNAIEALPGVTACTVSLSDGKVSVEASAPVSAAALKDAVEGIGFGVKE